MFVCLEGGHVECVLFVLLPIVLGQRDEPDDCCFGDSTTATAQELIVMDVCL